MNAVNLLKLDHKKINKLLDTIDATTSRAIKKREKLFKQLVGDIRVHTKIEEKYFYAALENSAKIRGLILEGYEEHRLVEKIISDLSTVGYADEKWQAKFSVLRENLQHHIKEEEEDLFPTSKTLLTNTEMKQLGQDMEALKQKLQTGSFATLFGI